MNTTRYTLCPTCWHTGHSQFNGQQHWPPAIVRLYDLPPMVNLWTCPNCHSTVSETDLLAAPACRRFVWRASRPTGTHPE